jgi:hypothetical protein
MLESLARDKQLIILGPFISYAENEVLSICLLESSSKHLISYVTYEWAQFMLKSLASDKHSNLLGLFISHEEHEES